jgi:hypothetical protein
MAKLLCKRRGTFFLFLVLVLACSLCRAAQDLDKSRYITTDEIKPGDQAYCLSVYKGDKVEKFALEVLDVIHNWRPGRDAILVQGTDERFIHTGPVAGCSGSPVYIDGRIAGALSFGFMFSKDPFYGVMPIEEMLEVGRQTAAPLAKDDKTQPGAALAFDFSRPIDLAEIERQITAPRPLRNDLITGAARLPCPLVISGLPGEAVDQIDASVRPFGFMAVAGIGGGTNLGTNADKARDMQTKPQLTPGACLAVPLMTGDITWDVVGTATEVADDKVYAFGHSFLGYGPIDLPMAAGRVHTVISSTMFSFKLASATQIVGAFRSDQSAAMYGQIGAEARMIPLTIRVDRYNDPETQVYNCRFASNRLLSPWILRRTLPGALLTLGSLPPDHTIKYEVTIGIADREPIAFKNVSTALNISDVLTETAASVALLMGNPYESVDIESIEMNVSIEPKRIISRIWSLDLADSKLKAGEQIEFDVVVESFLAGKKKYEASIRIPDDLAPGKYSLMVCGGYDYLQFLMKATPHKFVAKNLPSMLEAINNILAVKRDRLYCVLALPAGGITLERAELPDLPGTKALVLLDPKRTLKTQPYQHWVEKSFNTGTITLDKKIMRITVEK